MRETDSTLRDAPNFYDRFVPDVAGGVFHGENGMLMFARPVGSQDIPNSYKEIMIPRSQVYLVQADEIAMPGGDNLHVVWEANDEPPSPVHHPLLLFSQALLA